MAVTDVIWSGDDLVIEDGDFLVNGSEQQHIRDIIESNRGEWRQHPLLGAEVTKLLNSSESVDSIRKRLSLQLRFDNFEVEEITVLEENNFRIIARQREA